MTTLERKKEISEGIYHEILKGALDSDGRLHYFYDHMLHPDNIQTIADKYITTPKQIALQGGWAIVRLRKEELINTDY